LDVVAAIATFGALHRLILDMASECGVAASPGELAVLASRVNAAIGRAAARQLRRHDRELHRMAHALRNPLGSALMALTLLRSKADLGEHLRLLEMAERNLKRLQGMIDQAVGESSPAAQDASGQEPI
jgi:signal transduction histidine kinase